MGKLSNLEFFRKVAETGEAPAEGSRFIYPPTIAKTLGFRLIEVGVGTATMELVADTETHANPMGTIHGGVWCDIADAAIGTAHATNLEEGESFTEQMVLRGSLEQLAPVLMTALTAGIGLIPLVVSGKKPGLEILYPVATVILGGLVTSTLFTLLALPTFYQWVHRWRRGAERA